METDKPACRACLATDKILFTLRDKQLLAAFQELLGTKVELSNNLPEDLCYICRHKILSFKSYKQKIMQAQTALMKHIDTIGLSKEILAMHAFCCNMKLSKSATEIYSYDSKSVLVEDNKFYLTVKLENDTVNEDNYIKNESEISSANPKNKTNLKIDLEKHSNDEQFEDVHTEDISVDFIKVNDDEKEEFAKEVSLNKISKSSKYRSCGSKPKFKSAKRKSMDDNKAKKTKMSKKNVLVGKNVSKNKNENNYCMKDYNFETRSLTKEEQMQKFEARKESAEYINARYKCHICYKGIATESVYKTHMTTHQPSCKNVIECWLCHIYLSKKIVNQHDADHSREFTCTTCGESVRLPFIKSHHRFHTGVKYECKECSKFYTNYSSYMTHLGKKHADTACRICENKFNGERGIEIHMNKRHRQAAECETCKVMFNDKNALNTHLPTCNNPAVLRHCNFCGEHFDTKEIFQKHFKAHVKEIAYKWEGYCGEIKKKRINAELNKKLNQLETVCEICGKAFKTMSSYCNHKRMHLGETPYACEYCQRTFRLKHMLQVHVRTHTGEKPFTCQICGKSFRQQQHLTGHLRWHAGEKPYQCTICEKHFASRANVRIHIRTVHKGEKIPTKKKNNSATVKKID